MTPKTLFLNELSRSWKDAVPAFNPVRDPVVSGKSFLCSLPAHGKFYFIMIDFKHGGSRFTISVGISKLPDMATLQPSTDSIPTVNSTGIFAIWQFMNRYCYHWQLSDIRRRFTPEDPDLWKPTTYDQPVKNIVDEAIESVNSTLSDFCFPILKLDVKFSE
jgi:hypothetical protein